MSQAPLDQFFEELETRAPKPAEILLRRALNEAWFSDTLAWLLDPKASHGLGASFVRGLVSQIAKERVKPTILCEGNHGYQRRQSRLTSGRAGKGTLPSALRLANGSPIREFFLSPGTGKGASRGQQYCDVLFVDLDSSDGFVLAIENKLFTTNHPGQLAGYYNAVESKFSRAKVREFVYLTLRGDCPARHRIDEQHDCKTWVRMSWLTDVVSLLQRTSAAARKPTAEVAEFLGLLHWLGALADGTSGIGECGRAFSADIVRGASECLVEELNRISAAKEAKWSIDDRGDAHCKIRHTSAPKSRLFVELQASQSLAIQGRLRKQAHFEKFLIPFGSHPDQIFNLIDVAAREIFHGLFARPATKLGSSRRLRTTKTAAKKRYDSLFRFAHRRKYELQVLRAIVS